MSDLKESAEILTKIADNRREIRQKAINKKFAKDRAKDGFEELFAPITDKLPELSTTKKEYDDKLGTEIQNFTSAGREKLAKVVEEGKLALFASKLPSLEKRQEWLLGTKGEAINTDRWTRLV